MHSAFCILFAIAECTDEFHVEHPIHSLFLGESGSRASKQGLLKSTLDHPLTAPPLEREKLGNGRSRLPFGACHV